MDLVAAKIIAMVLMGALALFFGLIPLKIKAMILKGEENSRKRRRRERFISGLLCFGSGVLIATVFIHMIPETREGFSRAKKLGLLDASKQETSHTLQGHHSHHHDSKESHSHVENNDHYAKGLHLDHHHNTSSHVHHDDNTHHHNHEHTNWHDSDRVEGNQEDRVNNTQNHHHEYDDHHSSRVESNNHKHSSHDHEHAHGDELHSHPHDDHEYNDYEIENFSPNETRKNEELPDVSKNVEIVKLDELKLTSTGKNHSEHIHSEDKIHPISEEELAYTNKQDEHKIIPNTSEPVLLSQEYSTTGFFKDESTTLPFSDPSSNLFDKKVEHSHSHENEHSFTHNPSTTKEAHSHFEHTAFPEDTDPALGLMTTEYTVISESEKILEHPKENSIRVLQNEEFEEGPRFSSLTQKEENHDHNHTYSHSHDHDHSHDHNHESHDYPLAELVICMGFFLIYIIEEAMHKVSSKNKNFL